jgi:tetratricopeptide (TPR) repeat protein
VKINLRPVADVAVAMARGFRDGLREIWNLFVVIASFFDPRQLPRMIRRDTGAVIDSSKLVATKAGEAAADVVTQTARSPIRLAQWMFYAPGRLFFFLITRSLLQLAIGVVVIAATVLFVGWPLVHIIHERRLQGLAIEQHRQLDMHFARADFNGVMHNLDVLLKVNPDDEKVLARKKALETGYAPANDPKSARLLMLRYLGANRWNDAECEARTYLESNPNDWEALLIVTDAALRRGNRSEAAKLIAKLPRPSETRENISLWSCTFAARTFRTLNEQWRLDDLITYICDAYLPVVRRTFVTNVEPEGRIQLVEIYNLCMTTLAERPELQRYWVPIQEICHGVANAPDASAAVLVNLGTLQEIQRETYLRQMLAMTLINPEKHAEYAAEIDERLTTIWRRLREADAKHYLAYLGPAMQKARANDFRGAVSDIETGLSVCGPIPELIEKKAEVLRRIDPAGGLAFLESSLEGAIVNPAMCRVVGEAALAAGRPDKALLAAQKALQQYPNLPWAVRLAAQIHLDAGRPADAVAILTDAPIVFEDATVGALYVRALVASGALAEAEQFLSQMLQAPESRSNVLGGVDVLAKYGHPEIAVVVLKKFIVEDPLNPMAHVMLGDTLRMMAEKQPQGWNRPMIDEALRAYHNALSNDSRQLRIVNNIAWLELVALDLPRLAYDTAKPLRDAGSDLPPSMLETVGAVQVGIGAYEAGRIALEKSIAENGAKASTLAYLALAYHGLHQAEPAQQHINRAINTAKNGPREAELVESIRRRIERVVR